MLWGFGLSVQMYGKPFPVWGSHNNYLVVTFLWHSSFPAHVIIATEIVTFLAKTSKNNTFLDSGAIYHLSPHYGHFYDNIYTPLQQCIPIHLGNSSTIYTIATGTLQYIMDTPTRGAIPVEITNALHVPDMSCTLLSVSQFTKNSWHTVTFKGKQAIIIHTAFNSVIGLAYLTMSGLYHLQAHPCLSKEYAHLSYNFTMVDINHAHHCLDHLGHNNICHLVAKGMFKGINCLEDHIDFCETCTVGKQYSFSFSASNKQAHCKLDLIHSDLCGPFSPLCHSYWYYITFTDDCICYIWIYLFHTKAKAFVCFCEWKSMIELNIGIFIKVLQTDGGGEYESHAFNSFFSNCGILH